MIVFASDFGLADGYVGVVEAVIASIAPRERVLHLAHDIAPQDLRAGSWVLWSALPHVPAGAIVLGVVDPGVGSTRRAIAAKGDRHTYVGPDNGLFGAAWLRDPIREAVTLARDPALRARTFDGRDLFAPAAARIARGGRLDELGEALDAAMLLPAIAAPTREAEGVIWTFDRYGNAITTLQAEFGATGTIVVGAHHLALATHFESELVGAPVAYVGSSGLVEIAIRDGSARAALALRAGDAVSRLVT